MHMPKFIVKWRRQRAVNRVVAIGKQRRQLIIRRAGIYEVNEHTRADFDYLTSEIERVERQRDKLIRFIKTTPAY